MWVLFPQLLSMLLGGFFSSGRLCSISEADRPFRIQHLCPFLVYRSDSTTSMYDLTCCSILPNVPTNISRDNHSLTLLGTACIILFICFQNASFSSSVGCLWCVTLYYIPHFTFCLQSSSCHTIAFSFNCRHSVVLVVHTTQFPPHFSCHQLHDIRMCTNHQCIALLPFLSTN